MKDYKDYKDYELRWGEGAQIAKHYRQFYGTPEEAIQLARGVQLGCLSCNVMPPLVEVWELHENGRRNTKIWPRG